MIDLISRQDVIELVKDSYYNLAESMDDMWAMVADVEKLPSVQRWIPVKWHTITEEEREREGYPKEWVIYLDCEMPADGERILVQNRRGEICSDECYEDGEYSLDSGRDWVDDIVAWMPLPEPYKGE